MTAFFDFDPEQGIFTFKKGFTRIPAFGQLQEDRNITLLKESDKPYITWYSEAKHAEHDNINVSDFGPGDLVICETYCGGFTFVYRGNLKTVADQFWKDIVVPSLDDFGFSERVFDYIEGYIEEQPMFEFVETIIRMPDNEIYIEVQDYSNTLKLFKLLEVKTLELCHQEGIRMGIDPLYKGKHPK